MGQFEDYLEKERKVRRWNIAGTRSRRDFPSKNLK